VKFPRTLLAVALSSLLVLTLLPTATPAAPGPERAMFVFPASADRTTPAAAVPPNVPTTGGWIGPGAHLLITFDSVPGTIFGCTANYLWKAGTTTYLGAAGHCYIPPGTTATHGTGADYNPSGTHVRVCVSGCEFGGETGFIIQGTTVALGAVAYGRQTASDGDIGNDFGIVAIPSSQMSRTTPTMPVWNGPTSGSPGVGLGAVCFYGNAAGLGETVATKARAGVVTVIGTKAWNAVLPVFEGDSGSALERCTADASGAVHGTAAVGIVTHLTVGQNTAAGTTMARAEQMATEAGLTITPVLSAI